MTIRTCRDDEAHAVDEDCLDLNGSAAITRAARVLQLLHDHPQGLNETEIGERHKHARSTIGRTISAMRDEGLISLVNSRGPYRIGPAISAMARSARRSAAIELRAALEQSARVIEETAQLFVAESGRGDSDRPGGGGEAPACGG